MTPAGRSDQSDPGRIYAKVLARRSNPSHACGDIGGCGGMSEPGSLAEVQGYDNEASPGKALVVHLSPCPIAFRPCSGMDIDDGGSGLF